MTGTLRILEHNALVYRRTWRGSIFASFVSPILFLAAIGLGLGTLVSRGSPQGVNGVSYLDFLAPGLLATATMQTAFSETTYRLMARIRWAGTYDAMLATPLSVRDIRNGELTWLALRLLLVALLFFVAMVLFHTLHSATAALTVPVAALNGLAFAAPMIAFTATQQTDTGFAVIGRFVITPLFLLGGAFFPIDRLPSVIQAVAWLTPLAHGVALTRGLSLGTIALPAGLLHLGVLIAYTAAGAVAAGIALERRLAR
jgi:lipooligosaccharide transport system permease protein